MILCKFAQEMSEKKYISFGLEKLVNRREKEIALNQHAIAIWFYGLSGSGKSTLAVRLEKALYDKNFKVQILDGDIVREGINKGLSFSDEDRMENIRRVSEVNRLFIDCGIITINSFVSPTIQMRQAAKEIIGEDNFIEIFINSPIEVCEARDPKGLYKLARLGIIKSFTGIDDPFEVSESSDLVVDTTFSIDDSVNQILTFLLPKIELK